MTEKRQIYGPQRSNAKMLNLLQNSQYCEIYYSLEEAFECCWSSFAGENKTQL